MMETDGAVMLEKAGGSSSTSGRRESAPIKTKAIGTLNGIGCGLIVGGPIGGIIGLSGVGYGFSLLYDKLANKYVRFVDFYSDEC